MSISSGVRKSVQFCFSSKAAKIFISLAISLGILAYICVRKRISFDTLGAEWAKIDQTILVATIIFSAIIHIFVGAHKLWRIMHAMGVEITYGEMLLVRLGAGPLRFLVPLKAGELVNVLYFYRHKEMSFGRASGAVIFDKGLNMIGTTYWLLLGVTLLPGLSSMLQTLFIGGLGLSYILFFFCVPLHDFVIRAAGRLHAKVGQFAAGVLAPFKEFSAAQKIYFLLYGLVFTLRPLVVCFLLFYAYGITIGIIEVLARASVAILAGHMPATVVGMGAREWAVSEMFSEFASKEIALSVGLLMTLTVHIIPMMLGVPWLGLFLKRLAKKESAEVVSNVGTVDLAD